MTPTSDNTVDRKTAINTILDMVYEPAKADPTFFAEVCRTLGTLTGPDPRRYLFTAELDWLLDRANQLAGLPPVVQPFIYGGPFIDARSTVR